jgi:hypothetical protein
MEHILQHGTDNALINLVKDGDFLEYVVTTQEGFRCMNIWR